MNSQSRPQIKFLKLGILGSLISVVADVFLAYFPGGTYGFETPFTVSIDKVYPVLAQASHTRLMFSNYLSAIGIPLGWFGLYFFYRYLNKQRLMSLAVLTLGTIGYAAGTLFHASLSYIATLFRMRSSPEAISYFKDFSQPFAYIFLIAIVVVSILLVLAIYFKKTTMPRWTALLTPLSVELIISGVSLVTPPAIKTFLVISIYNLSLLIFYSVSFCVVHKKVR